MSNTDIKNLKGQVLRELLKHSSVAVVGLGKSGISAAETLLKLGAKIFVSESQPKNKVWATLPSFLKSVNSEFGGHTRKILNYDLIVVSPGVHWDLPLLDQARKQGVPVWSELELGYRLVNANRIVAVTGTNGKTTTVSLIGDICMRGKQNAIVAGNIGKPLCDLAFPRRSYDILVLELSSYQLEGIDTFHPNIAVILNLTEDHLHRHGTMNRYARIKERILKNQTSTDLALLNKDDSWCRKMSLNCRGKVAWFSVRNKLKQGIFLDRLNKQIVVQSPHSGKTKKFPLPIHLVGLHNVENSCAAIGTALSLGISGSAILSSLKHFKGVEHRLEKVKDIDGVSYINDSKSTTVDSTLKALESFSQPIWLIMGGEDKGSPYAPLRSLVTEKVKGLFLIGDASRKIFSELNGTTKIYFSKTLSQAVKDASREAVSGDIVLLSPACASFDQFKNFEERGKKFKLLVKSLPENQ